MDNRLTPERLFRRGERELAMMPSRPVMGFASPAEPPFLWFPRFGQLRNDRVALGRYLPRAPTDPYVPALEHTVPLIMDSLRA